MTKAQRLAFLEAQFAANGMSAEPLPDQPATAPASPWITAAQAVIPTVVKPSAPKPYVAKPLKIGYVGIFPKEGATGEDVFEPYTMLSIENHAHGKAHRSLRLSQRYLDAVKVFVTANSWTLPKPRK